MGFKDLFFEFLSSEESLSSSLESSEEEDSSFCKIEDENNQVHIRLHETYYVILSKVTLHKIGLKTKIYLKPAEIVDMNENI